MISEDDICIKRKKIILYSFDFQPIHYSYNCMIFHTKFVSFNSDILQHIREGNKKNEKIENNLYSVILQSFFKSD